MKIVSVNTWGGRMTKEFLDFLKNHNDVDVFCLQEVYHEAHGKDTLWKDGSNFDLLNDIKKILRDYLCYFRPHLDDWWGLAIFVKNNIKVIEEGDHFVHKFIGHNPEIEIQGYTAKNIQFIKVNINDKQFSIFNIHGLWNGKGKTDTDDRILQSRKIVEFIKSVGGNFVLCGDFNLEPNTKSLNMIINELGCRDLIKEYGVTSTRTSLYTKPNKFADYIFVSRNIDVLSFKVLPEVISDHKPLEIDIV